MQKFLLALSFVCTALFSYSQSQKLSVWKNQAADEKVFVENKGQLDKKYSDGYGDILFANMQQGINMYWSAKGLTYVIAEKYLSEEAKREMAKEGESEEWEKAEMRYHYFHMKWLGANPAPQVVSENSVPFYYSYFNPKDLKNGITASAGKKIIYKNIYPNIDVEYTLPNNGGIKYSFIVHPGGDVNAIQMYYANAKSNLNSDNEIEINAGFCGKYLEHTPKTFYADETPVDCYFTLRKGVIGFGVPTYDKSKTLIIDPWVTNTQFPTSYPSNANSVKLSKTCYDVCYDYSGNAWVLGGDIFSALRVAKYNSAGALQWIYQVPLAPSGPWGGSDDLVGDIEVNKQTGTCYVAQGANVWQANVTGAYIWKLNSAGNVVKTFAGDKYCAEISRLRLTCAGRLYGTGGGITLAGQGKYQIFSIDTNLTAMTGMHVTTSQNGDHDCNLMTLDPSGNFMYHNFNYPAPGSPDFMHNNELYKDPIPALSPTAWINPGPIYHFVELNSIRYPELPPYSVNTGKINMFNGMVCGNGFLYAYNGDTLKKFDKATGAKIAEVKTNGKVYWNGGLDLDICEYVYAGVGSSVKVYDNNLSLVKTIALPDTSCYDLKIDKINNLLYACGVGYVCAIALTPPPLQLTTTFTPAGCGGCNGTASANISCNSTAFNYSWMPGGQTTANIIGLCAGTYTVIASSNISCAKTIGDTAIVTIPSAAGNPPTVNVNHTNASCNGNNGSAAATASGGNSPYTYLWSPAGGTNATATGLSAGIYTVTITDSKGCSVSDTVSIISSGSLAISAGPVTTICIGQTFTLTAAGGTNYLWSTGNTTSSISVSPTVTTSYSVAVTDTVSGCSGDTVVKITVSPPPVASATSATVCSGQSATLTASGGGNYLWNSGETTASITPVATSATTYSVLVSIGTCTASANSSVNVTPAPSVNLGSNQTICSGQNGTFNAGNSGASYLWSTGETSQSISVSSAGTYWVVVALNNCLAKDTVKTFSAPQIHLHDSSLCTTSPILLDAGDGAGSYLWSNGSTAQTISVDVSGSYWVQAMFGNCLSADTSHIAGEAGLGSLYVPNAFTPNGDHLNEIFLAKGTGIISFDMKVFDRWGNLIFISNDINKGWSGIIQGGNYALKNDGSEAAQEDVYIWKISYTTECYPKKVEKLMGQISIVK